MLNEIKIVLLSKLFYTLVFVIFIIPIIYRHLPVRIDFTQQNSLPYSIWITYNDLTIESDYILFNPPKSKYIKNIETQYLKKIACVENDYLQVTENREYYCNNKFIGKATKYDWHKKLVENFVYNGKIPKDKYFVIGTHPLSYDSKYFGFIDKKQILRKAKPIY